MRAPLLCGALVLQFFLSAVLAQGTTTAGEAHVLSAFTTRADPRVLSADVALGPVLQGELGALTERETIYQGLVERAVGRPLRVTALGSGEIVRYASLQGITPGQQLIQLDAGELSLLVQYDAKQKNITFIEQISAPPLRAAPEPPQPVVEAAPLPPPAPEVPKPPVAEVSAPAIAPAPVVAVPALAAPVVAAAPRTPPRPRGECVIKPVMSEDDLWNCSAPAKPSAMGALTAPAPVAAAAPAAPAALQAPVECVIKPVMSEEDLRTCAAAGRGRRVVTNTPSEPVAARTATQPGAPMLAKPPAPECVIKPVMTEEELRICAAASRQGGPVPAETTVRPVAVQAAPITTKPTPECVIKPVMSEEDMRICAAASRQTHSVSEPAPRPVAIEKAQPAAPQPASLPAAARDCVIKPVMSEEDLRACGVRR